jgi:hypothetical protein
MNDPKLTAVKCSISYSTANGYRSYETLGSMKPGVDDPIDVLASAVREASRLLALFGHPERATEETAAALSAAAECKTMHGPETVS